MKVSVDSNICWCVCCLTSGFCVAVAAVAHLTTKTDRLHVVKHLVSLLSYSAANSSSQIFVKNLFPPSGFLIQSDLCSLCQHLLGHRVTACQQVAWRPVFVLACVCTAYTHRYTPVNNTLHTWADMTHTQIKQETRSDDVTPQEADLSIFVFLSLSFL